MVEEYYILLLKFIAVMVNALGFAGLHVAGSQRSQSINFSTAADLTSFSMAMHSWRLKKLSSLF